MHSIITDTIHAESALTANHPSPDLYCRAISPHLDLSEKQISFEVKNARLNFSKTEKDKTFKNPHNF